jgi:hypothetical protein
MADYLSVSDTDFTAWMQNFITYANANLAALGLTASDLTPLQTAQTDWEAAYAANVSAQAQAQSARQTKDDARSAQESLLRPLVARLQSSPAVTDAQRQALQLSVRSTVRTPAATPTSRPLATVDTSQRLRHTISFVDEMTPKSRAKPDGATGCEIWVKVGDPAPADPNELKYLATDTRTPYMAEFDGADAGKTAYYMLRWVNTRGERGPWSQTVSATITN